MDIILFFVCVAISLASIMGSAHIRDGLAIFGLHILSAGALAVGIIYFGPALNTAVHWIQGIALLSSLLAAGLWLFASMIRVNSCY